MTLTCLMNFKLRQSHFILTQSSWCSRWVSAWIHQAQILWPLMARTIHFAARNKAILVNRRDGEQHWSLPSEISFAFKAQELDRGDCFKWWVQSLLPDPALSSIVLEYYLGIVIMALQRDYSLTSREFRIRWRWMIYQGPSITWILILEHQIESFMQLLSYSTPEDHYFSSQFHYRHVLLLSHHWSVSEDTSEKTMTSNLRRQYSKP